eukprot:CAMPEP_0206566080 /NCGR_PEP_ID=MMETSP0325_2-20121206/24456_1 /ASSEMBLY_ACC=CAM_ASM_000347 /TAXON_ID=2866 /ORGANISM="Crypthecodinium cohnii, Strain Seligo" /LENGTH=50 /DNA_ID=CAMNT_0054069063 /DNA_START=446 /DNA_END=596 /DNA_ORIENTATION=-
MSEKCTTQMRSLKSEATAARSPLHRGEKRKKKKTDKDGDRQEEEEEEEEE